MEIRKFSEEVGGKAATHWLLVFGSERERDIVLRSLAAGEGSYNDGGRLFIPGDKQQSLGRFGVLASRADARGNRAVDGKASPIAIRLEVAESYGVQQAEIDLLVQTVIEAAQEFARVWSPLLAVFDGWAGLAPHEHTDVTGRLNRLEMDLRQVRDLADRTSKDTVPVFVNCEGCDGLVVTDYAEELPYRQALKRHEEVLMRLIVLTKESRSYTGFLQKQIRALETEILAIEMRKQYPWPNRLRRWWVNRHQPQPKKEVPPANEPACKLDVDVDYDNPF